MTRNWQASDIYWDRKGRIVVRDEALARKIAAQLAGPNGLQIDLPLEACRVPPPPRLADSMCGCERITLRLPELRNLHARDGSCCEVFRVEDYHFAAVESIRVRDERENVAVIFIDGADSRRKWRFVRGACGSEQIFF